MLYLKTLNLWDTSTALAIEHGQIKLQRGQWLQCGENDKKCRFVGLGLHKGSDSKSVWVVHYQGLNGNTMKKFRSGCKIYTSEVTA